MPIDDADRKANRVSCAYPRKGLAKPISTGRSNTERLPDPWTEGKLRTTLGEKLADAVGSAKLSRVALEIESRIEAFRRAGAPISVFDHSHVVHTYIKNARKAAHELRVNERHIKRHLECVMRNAPADSDALLAVLDLRYPERPDDEAKRKGGHPKIERVEFCKVRAEIVRDALKAAAVELPHLRRKQVITEIVARMIDDFDREKGKVIRGDTARMVRGALSQFFGTRQ